MLMGSCALRKKNVLSHSALYCEDIQTVVQ